MWVKHTALQNTPGAGMLPSLQTSKREWSTLLLCKIAVLMCKHKKKKQMSMTPTVRVAGYGEVLSIKNLLWL